MARSTYIYVLLNGNYVYAAFTVKYELINFIISEKIKEDNTAIYRLYDGQAGRREISKQIFNEILNG